MAFGFKADESVPEGVKRVVRRQIDAALSSLGAEGGGSDDKVHDARKRLKKARAALRLVRGALGGKAYRRENRRFRDAGRPLTEARDAKVLIDTLDGLLAEGGEAGPGRFGRLREALETNRRGVRESALGDKAATAGAREGLEKGLAAVKKWKVSRSGWRAVRPGLKCVYKAGRRAMEAARADASAGNLHEWRKQAKYLRYGAQLLEGAARGPMRELAEQAHELEQALGRDHDLEVLRGVAEAAGAAFDSEGDRDALLALIRRRREALQREAFRLGGGVYEDKPRAFVARVGELWKSWRREAKWGAAARAGK